MKLNQIKIGMKKPEIKKITLLSAYGRSLWLATELRRKGYEVCYLDFTHVLGDLSPDAWDSPYGVFQTKNTSFSQSTWLAEGASLDIQENGFIFFSNKGPIEFRGLMSRIGMKRYGITEEQMDYVRQSVFSNPKDFFELNKKIDADPFQKRWFLNYIHQTNSSTYLENYKGLAQKNKPLPLNENWLLRKLSRRGTQQALQMTHDKGVYVDEVQALQSISTDFRRIKTLKWTNQKNITQEYETDVVLNFLSQEELQVVTPKVFEEIFGGKAIHSDWFWTRYRYFVQTNDVINVLPKAFSLVHHIFLPWTHENNLVIHRGLRNDEFVVWCRMPNHYRLQKNHIETLSSSIAGVLKNHFPTWKVISEELPVESLPNEHQVKAPHLPVYDETTLYKMKRSKFSNFIYFGPEVWERLDLGYILDLQMQVLNQVVGTEEQMGISRRRGRDNEIYS